MIKQNFIKNNILIVVIALICSYITTLAGNVFFSGDLFAKENVNYIEGWEIVDYFKLIMLWILFLLLGFGLKKLYQRKAKIFIDSTVIRKKTWKIGLLSFVIIMIAWSPYLLTFFPSAIYIDGYNSVFQALSKEYTNHHPILYSFLVNMFLELGSKIDGNLRTGFFAYTVGQTVVMAGVMSYFVVWLRNKKLKKFYCVIVIAFISLFPLFPFYAVTLWKETFFSLAMFLFLLYQIDVVLSEGEKLSTPGGIYKYLFLAFWVCFLRNNGIYVFFCSFLAILFICRKIVFKQLKCFVLYAATFGVLTLVVQGPVYEELGLSTAFVESLGVTNQQIFAVFQDDLGKYDEEEAEFISHIWNIEEIDQEYTPCLADTPKWYMDYYDNAYLQEHKAEYFKVWFSLGLKNPITYCEAWLMNTLGFWSPIHSGAEAYIQYGCWDDRYGINPQDLFAEIFGWSFGELVKPEKYLSAGLLFWMVLFMIVVTAVNMDKGKKSYPFTAMMPVIALWLTLMIATPIAISFRYAYILVLIIPLIPILPVIFGGKEAKQN